jgi:DNA (cytosine-5)-methyltransferase 1
MRVIAPREATRLMGILEDYLLPKNQIDALSVVGDGVVVPLVRHLVKHVIEPALTNVVVSAGATA